MAMYSNNSSQGYHSGGQLLSGNYESTIREFILPEIAYQQAVDTPLLSSLPRRQVKDTTIDWVLGNFDFDFNSTTIAADAEGKHHDPNEQRYRYRARSYCQIISGDIMVSDTQRLRDEVGVQDEYAHQVWEVGITVRQEMEKALMFANPNAGAVGTARKTMGLCNWAFMAGSQTDPTINGITLPTADSNQFAATYYDGPGTNIDLDLLNDNVFIPYWRKGAQLGQSIMLVGANVKRLISGFSMNYTGSGATLSASPLNERTVPAEARKLVDRIDVYDSDFGPIYVNKNRYMDSTGKFSLSGNTVSTTTDDDFYPYKGLVMFTSQFVELAVYRGFTHKPMAVGGDNTAGFVVGEMGLVVRNPRGLALARNVTA